MSFPGPEKELAKRVEDLIQSDVEVSVTEVTAARGEDQGQGQGATQA